MTFESNLSHEPVGAGALLVFDDDVLVVVGHQVLEPGVVPVDGSLVGAARRDRVLRQIGHVLLEDQRRQFSGSTAAADASTGAAGLRDRREGQQQEPGHRTGSHLLRLIAHTRSRYAQTLNHPCCMDVPCS